MNQKVFSQFQKMIETTMAVGDLLPESIFSAAKAMGSSLLSGGTILTCGDKRGTISAELLTNYLTSGFEIERPGFPSINIGNMTPSDGDINSLSEIVNIHGKSSDILFVVSVGNEAPHLMIAAKKAIEKGMTTILLSPSNDKELASLLGYTSLKIETPDFQGELTTLAQLEIVQCLCSLIDDQIFGGI